MTDSALPPEGFEPFLVPGQMPRPRRLKIGARRARYHRRRSQLFMSLPRRERREQVVALGWKIRQDVDGQGIFLTFVHLPGSRAWDEGDFPVQVVPSVLFLPRQRQPDWFYNARIQTVASTWAQAILDRAYAEVEARVSSSDRARIAANRAIGIHHRQLPNGCFELWSPSDLILDSLGGHTEAGAKAQWLRDHWGDLPTLVPAVGPHAQWDEEDERHWKRMGYGVQYGRPLNLVTAEPILSVTGVRRAIKAFLDQGGQPYQGEPQAFDTVRAAVESRLRAQVWRWDRQEAAIQGRPMPQDLDPKDVAFLDDSLPMNPAVWPRRS